MVSHLRRNSFNSRYIPSYVTCTTHLPYRDRVRMVYTNIEDNTILPRYHKHATVRRARSKSPVPAILLLNSFFGKKSLDKMRDLIPILS